MIHANHSGFFESLFGLWLSFAFRRNFKASRIIGEFHDQNKPLLVLSNHISWWDGFWLLRLNQGLFKRKFHVMMLEEQLEKRKFLCKLGAFSIRRNHKSMFESLDYAGNLLQDPSNLLLIFPQGEISSQYDQPQVFQNGWTRILKGKEDKVQIVMVAHLLDYFSHSKPTLYQYLYSPDSEKQMIPQKLEEVYNDFFQRCLEKQKSIHK